MMQESIDDARNLLNTKDFGILSTLSLKLGGFPFGSVVPYCLDGEGMPVILISTIAEHTKNILHDNRCSITVISENTDVQANGRLTVIGNMEAITDEKDVSERYYRHFPKSKAYGNTHNFSFYRLRPIAIRFIGGFGAIHWLEVSDFLFKNPFHGEGEVSIVDHMNADHHKDLLSYCTFYKRMTIKPEDTVRMAGIDGFGFDIFVNDQKVRFTFDQAISNAGEARAAMVGLSKGAK